ncbi:CpaF family protein [Alkaliphilus crotonatoxidans]
MEKRPLNEVIELVKEKVREGLDLKSNIEDDEIIDVIERVVFDIARDNRLMLAEKQQVVEAVFNGLRRLDILQPLLEDDTITEIMVNGPDMIFIERQGMSHQYPSRFSSQQKLEDVIQAIVSKVNRVVNESSPIVDARLQDGSRVNVVLPPIAINGPILTIRKFPQKPMTIEDLINGGAITEEAATFLKQLVVAKYNIFVCGGTGSGKTTLLNVLSNFIPREERIITIEDSAELQILEIDNLVRLETRNANVEGKGAVSIRELIRASLRMRPERIIVGEVRGAEAIDMLQAMNTGHDGSLSTGHANSTKDMISRLETMVLSGSPLPLEAIRQQIASGIDIMVHLSRLRDKSRRVMEISEVAGIEGGQVKLNPLFLFEEFESGDQGPLGRLIRTSNLLLNTDKLKMAGIAWKG